MYEDFLKNGQNLETLKDTETNSGQNPTFRSSSCFWTDLFSTHHGQIKLHFLGTGTQDWVTYVCAILGSGLFA